jgi:hypothetical protein
MLRVRLRLRLSLWGRVEGEEIHGRAISWRKFANMENQEA